MQENKTNGDVEDKIGKMPNNSYSSLPPYESSNGYNGHDSMEVDTESEERRRAAQRVFSKQG